MGALGVVDPIGAGESFAVDDANPTLPGAQRAGSGSLMKRDDLLSQVASVEGQVARNLAISLDNARYRASVARTSTTLAALAQAYEMNGHGDEATATADEALALSALSDDGALLDPAATRIALGVLFRAGAAESGLAWSRSLPIGPHLRLVVAALLGEEGRFEEAQAFVDAIDVPERDGVLGFLAVKQGSNQRAVSYLRAALRHAPDDADSAFNLSIALWRLGSHRKALQVAHQAALSAPGRMDIALHYLQLLLAQDEAARVDREVTEMIQADVDAPARLLILHAQAVLTLRDYGRAFKLLERAQERARAENDEDALVEVTSNLIRLRAQHGKTSREDSFVRLLALHREHSTAGVVVANLAQVADRKKQSNDLRKAFDAVRDGCSAERKQFIEYQIASLEGDNLAAADHAVEWARLDPNNLHALAAAVVALGIGAERWDEAREFAIRGLQIDSDRLILNNAAYTFAMAGEPEVAIAMLEPFAEDEFVLKATLGLSCLAAGDVQRGMRLYREAAKTAERRGDRDSCSLMTEYQALVVRQLGLLDGAAQIELAARALPPVSLPDDWSDRPEFLRLKFVADRHGYGWPLSF